jgi:cytochrome P450
MSEPDIRPVKRNAIKKLREVVGFIKDPLNGFREMQNQWGDVVPLALPGPRTIQFTHPTHVGAILHLPLKDHITRSIEDAMGQGLLTSSGASWKRHRRMVSPAFAPKLLTGFIDEMVRLTHNWLDCAAGQQVLNISEQMLGLTLDVILNTIFGGKIVIEKDVVARGLEDYMYQFYLDTGNWRQLLPKNIMTPGRHKRVKAMQNIEKFVYDSIARRKTAEPGNDLLYQLLQARDEDGSKLSDKDLRDELITLILAGHETTALMLSYALWLLAKHPEIQQEVRNEVVSSMVDGLPTKETIQACRLLDGVLDEALRLFPPAYVVAREAQSDMIIGGIGVKKGDQLIVPAWVIHRDRRWWQQPDAFRPQRWFNGETDNIPANAYFPFGGGPRLCIGKHFAKFEGAVVLALLLGSFEFSPVPGFELKLMQSITLRPKHGIRLQIRRTKSEMFRRSITPLEQRREVSRQVTLG